MELWIGLACLVAMVSGHLLLRRRRSLPQMSRDQLKLAMRDWGVEPPPRWWESKRRLRARARRAMQELARG